MKSLPFSLTLLIFSGTILDSCTGPGTKSEREDNEGPALIKSATPTAGTQVDSLNGIPGHHFGEPLSAFPGLVLTQGQQPGTQTYSYPDGKPEPGWFGKHRKDVPSVFYVFKDGKFVAFQAIAYGPGRAALQEETMFLLGRGKQNMANTTWDGEQARALYTPKVLPYGAAEILDIQSLAPVKAQASESSDRLKRENNL